MSLRTKVALSQKQSTNAEAEEQKAYLQKRVESLEFAVQTALQDQSNSAAIVSWGLRQAASWFSEGGWSWALANFPEIGIICMCHQYTEHQIYARFCTSKFSFLFGYLGSQQAKINWVSY